MGPTLAGYLTFLRTTVGISTANLPDSSPVISMSYNVALLIVNQQLAAASVLIYQLAVYNLATSNLLSYAPDPGAGGNPPDYFSALRKKWNLLDFIPGVVESSSDNGSSESMVTQEAFKNFTMMNLQQIKDPYGRQYISLAQSVGTLWGMN